MRDYNGTHSFALCDGFVGCHADLNEMEHLPDGCVSQELMITMQHMGTSAEPAPRVPLNVTAYDGCSYPCLVTRVVSDEHGKKVEAFVPEAAIWKHRQQALRARKGILKDYVTFKSDIFLHQRSHGLPRTDQSPAIDKFVRLDDLAKVVGGQWQGLLADVQRNAPDIISQV